MIGKSDFFDGIKALFSGRKKYVAFISGTLILMTCIALAVFIAQKSKKKRRAPVAERTFTPSHELLAPDGPQEQKDYIASREAKDAWSDADIERWFTPPSGKEIEDLRRANDKIVSDIVGASP